MLRKLRTREILKKIGVIDDSRCLLCGNSEENISHLYFECIYSWSCVQGVMQWMEWKPRGKSLEELLIWPRKAKLSMMKKRVFYAVIAALVYHIWRVRNDALWLEKIWMTTNTIKGIQMRLRFVMPKKASRKDRVWAEYICTK